jgi:hypothetical protein
MASAAASPVESGLARDHRSRMKADDETFHQAAELVETLAAHHGLSEVRLGRYSGEVVATVAVDRDYFDLMQFEMELENFLREVARGIRRRTGCASARASGRTPPVPRIPRRFSVHAIAAAGSADRVVRGRLG